MPTDAYAYSQGRNPDSPDSCNAPTLTAPMLANACVASLHCSVKRHNKWLAPDAKEQERRHLPVEFDMCKGVVQRSPVAVVESSQPCEDSTSLAVSLLWHRDVPDLP